MECAEYIEIKNNIITGHYCGYMPEVKNPEIEYRIVNGCGANIGDDVRMYENVEEGILKPLKTLVEKGFIKIPEGQKLNEDGSGFIKMTEAEKAAAGLIKLKPDEKIEGDFIVEKTKKELFDEGQISKEQYNAHIDKLREAAYRNEADTLGMQVLRGDIEREVWLEKIAEIKKRYPKVE